MLRYLLVAASIALNVVLVLFFLKTDSKITNVYTKTIDGTPKYEQRIEMPNGDSVKRILLDGSLVQESVYFSDGSKKEIRNYNNNQKHGDWIIYYQNNDTINKDRKKQYSSYKDGKLLEMVDYRYEGSIRKLSVPMQNAESSQMITNYYSNGQIESMGKVRLIEEGKKTKYGNWIWYDEQGFVRQEKSFD
jgi:antitoxin component YwqK of YwqJK toxin-antitoxin module